MNVVVGTRIIYQDNVGTVLYAGKVGNNTGQWLGVEWDDLNRGKHDGSHAGVNYFKTKSPRAGSFIRPKNVDTGIPCVVGIKERYGSAKEKEENFGICKETLILPQAPGSQTRVIEVVGMKDISETQSKYDTLKVVSLRNMRINGAGPPNVLYQFSPCIQELDLSKNLIPSWDSLAELTVQLQYLKFLNISENRLSLPNEPEKLIPAFKSVRQLLLQKMNYNWEQILVCLLLFPEIEYLAIAGNVINFITPPASDILRKLKELNLEFNNLKDWEEVMKLGQLASLECMNISNNGLTSLYFKDAHWSQKTKFFPKLKVLSVSNNKLSSWKDLAELNKLQALDNLTIRNNPVIDSYSFENIRMNLFSLIGGLKVHNHSEFSAVDRKGAEYEYFRTYAKKWSIASEDAESVEKFYEEHPRYKDMISAFGMPDPAEMEEKPKVLKSNLIKVTITSSQLLEHNTYAKNVSKTMSIKKLKGLVQRMLKYDDIQNLELSYKDSDESEIEVPLDNDLRQLSFYSIENNSIIMARWRSDIT